MKIVNSVNLIILNNQKQILLAKRVSSNDQPLGENGKWCIPGGTVEERESLEEGLVREVREELNCKIVDFQYFKSYYWPLIEDFAVRACYFYGQIEGEIKLNHELSEFKWYDLNNEVLGKLDLAYNQDLVLAEFIELQENTRKN